MVTAKQIRQLLDYDPQTGEFTWKARPSPRSTARVGDRAGRNRTRGVRYCQIQIAGIQYLAHRLAWLYVKGAWPRNEIDHRNGDGFDNRWCNLREATRGENMQNLGRSKSSSGRVGVHWGKNAWNVRVKVNGQDHYIGRFLDLEAAFKAHADAKRRYHKYQQEPRS